MVKARLTCMGAKEMESKRTGNPYGIISFGGMGVAKFDIFTSADMVDSFEVEKEYDLVFSLEGRELKNIEMFKEVKAK